MQTLDQIKCPQCGSPYLTYGDNTEGAPKPGVVTLRNGMLIACQSCGTKFRYGQDENNVAVLSAVTHSVDNAAPSSAQTDIPKLIWDDAKQQKVINPNYDWRGDMERRNKQNKYGTKAMAWISGLLCVPLLYNNWAATGITLLIISMAMFVKGYGKDKLKVKK